MCGRYYTDDDLEESLRSIKEIGDYLKFDSGTGPAREQSERSDHVPGGSGSVIMSAERSGIHDQGPDFRSPAARVGIAAAGNGRIELKNLRWGYPGFRQGARIFNARAETAAEKGMFRRGILGGRVVVPASGFYEWNSRKEKYECRREDGELMFMAGFADEFQMAAGGKDVNSEAAGMEAGGAKKDETESCFVILTTEANRSMKNIHSRMPLILEKEQIRKWIFDWEAAREILKQVPAALETSTPYEQLSLFGSMDQTY